MTVFAKSVRQSGKARAAMLFAAVLLTGCDDGAIVSEPRARPVRVVAVDLGKLEDATLLAGEIQPQNEVSFAFRIPGRVVERPVNVGDRVKAGQLLARLDAQVEENALRVAQANVKAAEGQVLTLRNAFERQEALMVQGFTTRPRYEQAEQALRAAQAQLEDKEAQAAAARDRLTFTQLHADAGGIVTARGVEPGEVVQAGQAVVQVARENGRDAVFHVPAPMLSAMTGEAPVEVALADDATVAATGRVREVAAQADPVTRTFQVRIGLDDPPSAMPLGSTVIGRIARTSAALVTVPATALTQASNEPAVWVLDPSSSTVVLRRVDVLSYGPRTVVIAQGLEPGEAVVTAGTQALHPGQRVRILPEPPPESKLSRLSPAGDPRGPPG